MLNLILSSMGISPPPFLPRLGREERAVREISDHLGLDFDSVLSSFSELEPETITYANGENMEGLPRVLFFRENRLSKLRITLGLLDPSGPKTRRKRIKILDQALKRQAKLLKDVEAYGRKDWDRDFGYLEGQSYDEMHNFLACLIGEHGTRVRAEKMRDSANKGGRTADERPVFIACRIADVFIKNDWKVGAGRDFYNNQGPSGDFCKTVVLAFKEFGIEHDFYRPAKSARDYAHNILNQK